jgi:hypothetical protein
VRFAVLGAALFALDRWRTAARGAPPRAAGTSSCRRDFVAGLRAGLWRERGREPGQAEFEARLAEHVRDEVLYRSALARGLDRGDGIIRRRLVQKATYLLEAEAEPAAARRGGAARRGYDAHPEALPAPSARIGPRAPLLLRRPPRRARAAAEAARVRSSSGAPGDPFLRGERHDRRHDARSSRGSSARPSRRRWRRCRRGPWRGPVASALGQHLVRGGGRGARGRRRPSRRRARAWRESGGGRAHAAPFPAAARPTPTSGGRAPGADRFAFGLRTSEPCPHQRAFAVPSRVRASTVAWSYLRMGARHIAEGADHLAFLACLALWVGRARGIVAAVTGFTLGHSLTLALAATEAVRAPSRPVEACVALSVLLLALEVARGAPAPKGAWWVAAGFGLLHGLGFAEHAAGHRPAERGDGGGAGVLQRGRGAGAGGLRGALARGGVGGASRGAGWVAGAAVGGRPRGGVGGDAAAPAGVIRAGLRIGGQARPSEQAHRLAVASTSDVARRECG